MTKKSFKMLFTIIGALLLFSAILCIAVFGLISVSDHSANAALPSYTQYYCSGTFSQLVPSNDGIDMEWREDFPIEFYSASVLPLDGSTLGYPPMQVLEANYHYVSGAALDSSRTYFITFTLIKLSSSNSVCYVQPINNTGNLISGQQQMIHLYTADYYKTISYIYTPSVPCTLYFNPSEDFGIRSFMIVDISDLQFYYYSPATSPLYITDYTSFSYYFGTSYLPYASDVDIEDVFTYGLEGAYSLGYTAGTSDAYQPAYNEGYADGETAGQSAGYTSGYTDGYSAGETAGFSSGYSAGETAGYSSGYSAGETAGYSSGYSAGETAGYSDGFSAGEIAAYQPAYNDGYAAGETAGYSTGYTAGYDSGYNVGYSDFVVNNSNSSFYTSRSDFGDYQTGPDYGYYSTRLLVYYDDNTLPNTYNVSGLDLAHINTNLFTYPNVGFVNMFPNVAMTYYELDPISGLPTSTLNPSFDLSIYSFSFEWDLELCDYTITRTPVGNMYTYSGSYTSQPFTARSNFVDIDSANNIVTMYCTIDGDITNSLLVVTMTATSTTFQVPQSFNFSSNDFPLTGSVLNWRTSNKDCFHCYFYAALNNSVDYNTGYYAGIDYANNIVNYNSKSFKYAFDTVLENSASYVAGYNTGRYDSDNFSATFSDVISSAVDVPLKTVSSLLNFDFLGINLKAFIYSLLSLGLIIGIIKLIIGARS